MINRILRYAIISEIICFVFVWGCGQQGQKPEIASTQPEGKMIEPNEAPASESEAAHEELKQSKPDVTGNIELALKPASGKEMNYKTTAQIRRSVKWEGPVPQKSAFDESFNDEKIEMDITQRIESVNDTGKVVAKVTINNLKSVEVIKNNTELDFDSTRPSDANSSLAKIVGQNYTIEIEPNNYVTSVSGLGSLISWMVEGTIANRVGRNILSLESIRARQGTLLLPPSGKESLKAGDTWKEVKTFPFGMMGLKSYEKIYTLKEVKNENGRRIAIIDMSAIPTSEIEEKYKDKTKADFPQMFDSNDTYTGAGTVDLTDGCVNNYSEQLQASWIAAMPGGADIPDDANEPVVLRMEALRTYNLERIK